jgi:methylated-DNA-[protein]-cysteine S-methyltransferase
VTLVAYGELPSRIGVLRVAATEKGVCKIALGAETTESLMAWLGRTIRPEALVEQESAAVAQAIRQIAEYLDGRRRVFELPLDVRGTDFQRAVWAAVADVPYGQTRCYAQIAAAIGKPSATRAVGAANGANPLPLVIPCHRLVGKDGSLTGYGGGLGVKRFLLDMERS